MAKPDCAKLDELIVARVKAGSSKIWDIHDGAVAAEAWRISGDGRLRDPMRVVDGRMQALRKRGALAWTPKAGWRIPDRDNSSSMVAGPGEFSRSGSASSLTAELIAEQAAEIERLRSVERACKGLTALMGYIWDRIDGAAVIMPESVDRLDAAMACARSALGEILDEDADYFTQLEADAARYRWLRERATVRSDCGSWVVSVGADWLPAIGDAYPDLHENTESEKCPPDVCDAAIDAARAKEAQG